MNKKLYALLTLGMVYIPTQAIDTISGKLLENVNVEKIINAIQHEAETLHGKTANDIIFKIHQILAGLPDRILGQDITHLKSNTVNPTLAAQLKIVLPYAYELANKELKPFFAQPRQAVIAFSFIFNAVKESLPASIRNLYEAVLNLAHKIVNSPLDSDKRAVAAIQQIFQKGVMVINDLYNNRDNLVGYDLTQDLTKLTTALIAEFPAIQNVIRDNLSALQDIFSKARAIKKEDIINLEKMVEAKLKESGLIK